MSYVKQLYQGAFTIFPVIFENLVLMNFFLKKLLHRKTEYDLLSNI